MENDGMDIKLRDNIDSAQFSERSSDKTLHPGFLARKSTKSRKSHRVTCNEFNELQA